MNLVLDDTEEQARARSAQHRLRSTSRARAHSGSPALRTTSQQSHRRARIAQVSASEKNPLGMVVIRGNSVVTIEGLEKLWDYVPPPNR